MSTLAKLRSEASSCPALDKVLDLFYDVCEKGVMDRSVPCSDDLGLNAILAYTVSTLLKCRVDKLAGGWLKVNEEGGFRHCAAVSPDGVLMAAFYFEADKLGCLALSYGEEVTFCRFRPLATIPTSTPEDN